MNVAHFRHIGGAVIADRGALSLSAARALAAFYLDEARADPDAAAASQCRQRARTLNEAVTAATAWRRAAGWANPDMADHADVSARDFYADDADGRRQAVRPGFAERDVTHKSHERAWPLERPSGRAVSGAAHAARLRSSNPEAPRIMHDQIASHLAELRALCRRFAVARLEIFGSAARGADFDPTSSDADFLVEFQPEARLPPLQQFFGLSEALERLLGRRVDLIETGAVRNPYILAEIDRARELIYAA